MREEFEKWCEEELNLRTIRLTTGDYQSFGADMAWRAWQTVHKRLSEAEKLLRGVHTGDLFGPEDWGDCEHFSKRLATSEDLRMWASTKHHRRRPFPRLYSLPP